MDQLINTIKGHAAQIDQKLGQPRLGVVSSVDPQTYTARVRLQPDDILSGWLPIAALWIGNNWGLACPPSAGDQVVILAQEGDIEHGIIIGRLWSSAAVPVAAPVGECWLVHQSGSYIKLHNDGSIESSAATWTHHGNLVVHGDVSDSHNTLADLRAHYNEHVHPPSSDAASPDD